MQAVQKRILVPPNTSQLRDLRHQLTRFCEQKGIDASVTSLVIMALDEALANVIEHGAVSETTGLIDVQIYIDDHVIVTEIIDEGRPFDPTRQPREPDKAAFPRRGFGLYLIHKIVDCMEYTRSTDGKNVLRLSKRLAPTRTDGVAAV